jgi:hypothetical protein
MPVVPAPAAPEPQSRATPGPATSQLMLVLRNSAYPFQREWAVNELSKVDWRGNPEVVQALLSAAQRDSAPMVRVACVKAIVTMKVDTVPVAMTLQSLKADTDPRVQRESIAALSQMHAVETVSATPAVLAAGARPNTVTIVPASHATVGSSSVQPAGNAFSQ